MTAKKRTAKTKKKKDTPEDKFRTLVGHETYCRLKNWAVHIGCLSVGGDPLGKRITTAVERMRDLSGWLEAKAKEVEALQPPSKEEGGLF